MSAFTKLGQRVRWLVQRAIKRFWVQSLEKNLIPRLSVERPNLIQSIVLRGSLWGAAAGRVLLEELDLKVIQWKSPDWSVVYIGTGFSAELLEHILFPAPPEKRESSEVFLWQVPGLVRKSTAEEDLVVCELSRIIHLHPKGVELTFTTPQWVRQVLDGINRSQAEVMATIHSTIRRKVRKLDAQGYHYVIGKSDADFDLFYHRMYVPNIETRHSGRSPHVDGYDFVHRFFEGGTLVLVKQGDEMVAGSICQLTGDTCVWMFMGVMDGRMDLVKNGANVALCWLAIQWAQSQGARRFDFCACRPMITDGVFNFKRQWGAKVTRYQDIYPQWKFYGHSPSSDLRDHLNKQGFISEIAGEHYLVVFLDPEQDIQDTDFTHTLKTLAEYGLAGIVTFSARGKRRVIRSTESRPSLPDSPSYEKPQARLP